MKNLFGGLALMLLLFVGCSDDDDEVVLLDTIDFEEITMGDNGYVYGTDTGDTITTGNSIYSYTNSGITLNAYINSEWGSWNGVSYSNKNDMTTTGYGNQYSVYYKDSKTGKGGVNGSNNFAVVYESAYDGPDYSPAIEFATGESKIIDHMYVTNSTYAFLSIKDGDGFAGTFEAGDWFKLTITGYDIDGEKKTFKEFYLADFRDGKEIVVTEWERVSLKELGAVNKVKFTLSGSDEGEWGLNTPTYFCMDNIAIQQ